MVFCQFSYAIPVVGLCPHWLFRPTGFTHLIKHSHVQNAGIYRFSGWDPVANGILPTLWMSDNWLHILFKTVKQKEKVKHTLNVMWHNNIIKCHEISPLNFVGVCRTWRWSHQYIKPLDILKRTKLNTEQAKGNCRKKYEQYGILLLYGKNKTLFSHILVIPPPLYKLGGYIVFVFSSVFVSVQKVPEHFSYIISCGMIKLCMFY